MSVPRRSITALVVVTGFAAAAAAGAGAVAGSTDPGPSAPLSPVTRHSGCHVHGPLPDHACTPGARFPNVTTAMVCTAGYARSVRHVTYAKKRAVYAAYGMRRHFNGHNGELDHLVALELGGSNDQSNLWPETVARTHGFHQKDRLENELHGEVCAGSITLYRARLIAGDWVKVYRSRFG
jgi:hypothetical protein